MTTFTLWMNHYHPTEVVDNVTAMSVGITETEVHVNTPFGEFWLPMKEVVEHVIQNGQECTVE